ncbi:hypothetical protein BDA99DRAFT_517994 [Phascolomyces articulosus]|uniref:Integrator complex subunit 7 n=1 Tax=Phascolomyces articulosus TaxID=60185 RepID=A0AAD5JUK0_9FUNG|nr:hypothetical protein BDA99DRAFT_517994 [Phascolomyces articulosus]
MSTSREQTEGHRALLEIESRFNAKSHGVVIAIQGIQIHALAMFADVFNQFPYPVVINAAILKLADWFRTSNNVIKFHIYKVFKQADQHLIKVINVEESMRRILPVLNSNDTVSRALALRVLGCMSVIIANKVDVQHAVLQRLEEATDRAEAEAAIWAADRFCAQSIQFSPTVFPTIEAKLKDPHIDVNIKLRLVQLFRHMHHNIAVARQAKSVCVSLLENPKVDQNLVMVVLRTLSLLLSQALLDRKEQLDRVFTFACDDSRKAVCLSALDDLSLLANNDLSIDPSHIYRLLSLLNRDTNSITLMERRYSCAQSLLRSYRPLVWFMMRETWQSESQSDFIQALTLCEQRLVQALASEHYVLAIACAKFLMILFELAHQDTKQQQPLQVAARSYDRGISSEAVSDLKAIATRLGKKIEESYLSQLVDKTSVGKLSIRQARHLFKLQAHLLLLQDGEECTKSFQNNFEKMVTNQDDVAVQLFAPFLLEIANGCHDTPNWFPDVALTTLKSCTNRPKLFVSIVQLLLRTSGIHLEKRHELSGKILSQLEKFGAWEQQKQVYTDNGWFLYIIASDAGCNGWHEIMYRVYGSLGRMVESEASKCWLTAVSLLGLAESSRENHRKYYLESLTYLQAFQSLTGSRQFQMWYIQLRMEMISIAHQLNQVLSFLQQTQNPSLSYKKKFVKNLQKCGLHFGELASRYDFIAQSFLAMDDTTLMDLETYKVCALVCEHAIRSFIKNENIGAFFCVDPVLIPLITMANERMHIDTATVSTVFSLQDICLEFLQAIINWDDSDRRENSDNYSLCAQDIQSFITRMLEQPLSLPRYFFGREKPLNVQLTVDPPLSDKQPIILQEGQNLTINFEGFVNLSGKEVPVEKASIVCSITEERTKHFSDKLGNKKNLSDPHPNEQTKLLLPPTTYDAKIVNSYFTCNGLLHIPKHMFEISMTGSNTGPCQEAWLNIFVNLVDCNNRVWATGPHISGKIAW